MDFIIFVLTLLVLYNWERLQACFARVYLAWQFLFRALSILIAWSMPMLQLLGTAMEDDGDEGDDSARTHVFETEANTFTSKPTHATDRSNAPIRSALPPLTKAEMEALDRVYGVRALRRAKQHAARCKRLAAEQEAMRRAATFESLCWSAHEWEVFDTRMALLSQLQETASRREEEARQEADDEKKATAAIVTVLHQACEDDTAAATPKASPSTTPITPPESPTAVPTAAISSSLITQSPPVAAALITLPPSPPTTPVSSPPATPLSKRKRSSLGEYDFEASRMPGKWVKTDLGHVKQKVLNLSLECNDGERLWVGGELMEWSFSPRMSSTSGPPYHPALQVDDSCMDVSWV
ncbi:unnamed protein product [Zymoseptoria tritici ST99CH_3D7]|uniref:Uncharacterized protein n=2 Tax=Zymoseptoria tritici TaxID=1047171 RepID=F9WWJ4_ZYMTI|nr:uncharacterized protein MYCGRDRAFT_89494 [Zymoseptoria tritici IPO323]EGP92294.1 hypothetical protein MYCGRDRAFT_89494 [Zymoseptoria tritici IPO323]SMQ46004.1 unnamed protein product [Zymoseptoria tritici ST99CH_3D7]